MPAGSPRIAATRRGVSKNASSNVRSIISRMVVISRKGSHLIKLAIGHPPVHQTSITYVLRFSRGESGGLLRERSGPPIKLSYLQYSHNTLDRYKRSVSVLSTPPQCSRYASSTSTPVNCNSPFTTSTSTCSPSNRSPCRILAASGSAMRCWITRFNGRAP